MNQHTDKLSPKYQGGSNPPKLIVEDESGDWRLYTFNDTFDATADNALYRAYHRHGDDWIMQLYIVDVCARCKAKVPEAMNGFEKLIRWEV